MVKFLDKDGLELFAAGFKAQIEGEIERSISDLEERVSTLEEEFQDLIDVDEVGF